MKKIFLLIAAFSVLSCGTNAQKKEKLNKVDKEFLDKQVDGIYAKFETNKGSIYAMLEFKNTPLASSNFIGLAEGNIKNTARGAGVPYYNGLNFHRVEPGFVIQGGDPAGNGSGGPGYQFDDEPVTGNYDKGVLAMANAGPNTNGSQFFIMLANNPGLPKNYTIFGKVLVGLEVVDKIAVGDTIKRVIILRKGKEAEMFDAAKVFEFEKTNVGAKASAATDNILKEKFSAAKATSSGLRVMIEKEGEGATITSGDKVTVHCTGSLLNGTKFWSSLDSGQPLVLEIGPNSFTPKLIAGMEEGIRLLKQGGKAKLIIPPNIGYGPQGSPPAIPPNSWLVFDVDIVKVEKNK